MIRFRSIKLFDIKLNSLSDVIAESANLSCDPLKVQVGATQLLGISTNCLSVLSSSTCPWPSPPAPKRPWLKSPFRMPRTATGSRTRGGRRAASGRRDQCAVCGRPPPRRRCTGCCCCCRRCRRWRWRRCRPRLGRGSGGRGSRRTTVHAGRGGGQLNLKGKPRYSNPEKPTDRLSLGQKYRVRTNVEVSPRWIGFRPSVAYGNKICQPRSSPRHALLHA